MAPDDPRLSLQESLDLIRIDTPGADVSRYMSTRPAWIPGGDLPWDQTPVGAMVHTATYGAHVYAMAAAAVLRAAREGGANGEMGLHSIQGCFTSRGLADRPFILSVTPASTGRSFAAYSVTARQPRAPSTLTPKGLFPPSDAESPLGPACFTGTVSLKSPEPTVLAIQGDPAQETYGEMLRSRPGSAWPMVPSVDIDWIKELFPSPGPGTFPILEMRKLDMTAHNAARPPRDRKEVLLYRLLKPLPEDDPNLHVVAHAFAADRNGLLMLCREFGFGWSLGAAATLSWSFYVHVDAKDAVMRGSAYEAGGEGKNGMGKDGGWDGEGWWVLEDSFERAAAGRGFIIGRIFSPSGLHVATAVQDGIARVSGDVGKL